MPAKSKSQQRAAGIALSAKRGDMDPSELKGAAKEMYDSMSEKELEDFAETEHEGLPEKVDESSDANWNSVLYFATTVKDPETSYKYNKKYKIQLDRAWAKLDQWEKEKMKGYWIDLTGQKLPIHESVQINKNDDIYELGLLLGAGLAVRVYETFEGRNGLYDIETLSNWINKKSKTPVDNETIFKVYSILNKNLKESVLNENAYIDMKARELNVSKSALHTLWKDAQNEQNQQSKGNTKKDSSYWKSVKTIFDKKIENLNVQEAKMIEDNRHEFKKNTFEFLDALVNDDYTKAGEVFPTAVKSKVINMVNNRKEIYLKQLEKQAKNIAKDN